jgi:TolB-like protein
VAAHDAGAAEIRDDFRDRGAHARCAALRSLGSASNETALAEGLSEELTTRLAHIEGLSLISQTSATLAQERNLGLDQLAAQLHVDHAIEGSLREAGEQLRIDLRLIEVPSGKTVWAQDYDRKLDDVFAIQRDIAQAVAGALALRLGLRATRKAAKAPTTWRCIANTSNCAARCSKPNSRRAGRAEPKRARHCARWSRVRPATRGRTVFWRAFSICSRAPTLP